VKEITLISRKIERVKEKGREKERQREKTEVNRKTKKERPFSPVKG